MKKEDYIKQAQQLGQLLELAGGKAALDKSLEHPRGSKGLLAEAFTHPQDSPQRLQVFSKFLEALRDEAQQEDVKEV